MKRSTGYNSTYPETAVQRFRHVLSLLTMKNSERRSSHGVILNNSLPVMLSKGWWHCKEMKMFILLLAFFPVFTYGQVFNLTNTYLEEVAIFRTYNIKFDQAKPWICSENNPILDSIFFFIQNNPNTIFEIGVHNNIKQERSNKSICIACKQAEGIKDYLIEKGINPERLIARGYNDSLPIYNEYFISMVNNEEEKARYIQLNARVEIKILNIIENSEPIFEYYVVETKPQFPGEYSEFTHYIAQNIQILSNDLDCEYHEIILTFTINKSGQCVAPVISVANCLINQNFEKNVVEMLSNMPNWVPGEQNGEKVNVRFTIRFNIDKN